MRGSALPVSWTAAAGATQYAASIFLETSGESSETEFTSGLSTTLITPRTSGSGQLTVTAYDRLTFARAAVVGTSERRLALEVTP